MTHLLCYNITITAVMERNHSDCGDDKQDRGKAGHLARSVFIDCPGNSAR